MIHAHVAMVVSLKSAAVAIAKIAKLGAAT